MQNQKPWIYLEFWLLGLGEGPLDLEDHVIAVLKFPFTVSFLTFDVRKMLNCAARQCISPLMYCLNPDRYGLC